MTPGAHTPEELESLLEDAFVTGDAEGVFDMFQEGAVLVAGVEPREARGVHAIRRLVEVLLDRNETYVAEPSRVVQARDTALVLGEAGLNVVRRGGGGAWQYAIALLSSHQAAPDEEER
ncbi:MAG TPA: nuclear transport factor 2 family protein [Gaiellaceae bacterium]|nr:nuclear transport factor 2 family protein [Gaiellaceae bacterium]